MKWTWAIACVFLNFIFHISVNQTVTEQYLNLLANRIHNSTFNKSKYHDNNQNKCYCLALSSSNGVGPYQAGVIKKLLKYMKNNNLNYDFISGINEGAINAYILAQFQKQDQLQAIYELDRFWNHTAQQQLYQEFTFSIFEGAFYESSLYDDQPLKDFIYQYFNDTQINGNFNIGIVNMLTGQFETFTENTNKEDQLKILLASLSIPLVFPPVQYRDQLWISGDTIWEIDIAAPVVRCKEMGYKESEIVVDVILNNNFEESLSYMNISEEFNAFQIAERSYQVMHFFNEKMSLIRAQRAFQDVNFRFIIGPKIERNFQMIYFNYKESDIIRQMELGQIELHHQIVE